MIYGTATETIVGAVVAIAIAGLSVLATVRTTRIKAQTDTRLNVITTAAAETKVKADATDRLVDQLQEQLVASAKSEIDIRRELLDCHRRETGLIVELAQTKAQSIIAQAEAKANHNAVETRVDRMEQLFALLRQRDNIVHDTGEHTVA